MLDKALLGYAANLDLAAMIVAAGVMILLASRDAFEVDSKLKEIRDPTGSIRTTWEWKYMSDFAQDARAELLHLVKYLRLIVTTMLVVSLVVFVVGFLSDQFESSQVATWWKSNEHVQFLRRQGFGLLILVFSPVFLFQLTRATYRVVRARAAHEVNKDPWWVKTGP